MSEKPVSSPPDAAHPDWFREPTLRELKIGAGLFTAFGVFFVLMFIVEKDWAFRWVLLALGVVSTVRGLWHLIGVFRKK
jgi:hypothetical protein